MSKFFIYTDVHFSEYSSILQSNKEKYSTRLEGLAKSLNWAESLSKELNCDKVICLGDFFDKKELNAAEITCLKNEIVLNDLPHIFLVGNHEATDRGLFYNTTWVLKEMFKNADNENIDIIYDIKCEHLKDCNLIYLPYFLDENRPTLKDIMNKLSLDDKPRIVLSHNDVKGIRYGMFESPTGIEIKDIQENCTLFLNGHLHNGTQFCSNGYNLGNFTGQNFGEDATKYKHCGFVLDTEKQSITAYENPYAFNFYKIEITGDRDLQLFSLNVTSVYRNAIISVKTPEKYLNEVREVLKSKNVISSRLIIAREIVNSGEDTLEQLLDMSKDHLEKFDIFAHERIENSEILDYELQEIRK